MTRQRDHAVSPFRVTKTSDLLSRPDTRRAVFLDRDGVLNSAVVRDGRPYSPAGLDDFEIAPNTPEALERLRRAGFLLICVTNQPDVARGLRRRETVEAMHRTLAAALPLDDLLVCYHDDADRCPCRKPAPGLLFEGARRHAVDLGRSFMVGDRWRDIEAGHHAGCRTVLIDHGYVEREPAVPPDCRARSLPDAVSWILGYAELSEPAW